MEKECLESLKGVDNVVKIKNIEVKFNTNNNNLTLKKADMEVQLKENRITYKNIVIPVTEYSPFINENEIKEEFFEKISDFEKKYSESYIPVSERKEKYKKNVEKNFNYNGWKVK